MHETADPSEVTRLLGMAPTKSQLVGSRVSDRSERVRKLSGWFLESAGNVDSRDARHHLDWLLGHLAGKQAAISQLLQQGYFVDICCRWDSRSGQGGPTLDPSHMKALGNLGIDLWFDIYFAGEGVTGD